MKTDKLVKELKEMYTLSDYEALDIAIKIETKDIIKKAFVVNDNDKFPVALEAIAMALGYRLAK